MFRTFNLSDLLRYAFSGSIFLATCAACKNGLSKVASLNLGAEVGTAGFVAAAVVAGSLCYSLHRSIYRHIVQWQLMWIRGCSNSLRGREFFDEEFHRDYARWIRRCNFPVFQERLDLWGAHVHFLYCSGWAAIAGAVFGRLIHTHFTGFLFDHFARPTFYLSLLMGLALAVAAFIQDNVLTRYDLELAKEHWKSRLSKDVDKPRVPQLGGGLRYNAEEAEG